jgi:hypothetical protein
MSIFRVEQLASAIWPTFYCSSCVFMYVHVTTCTGGSHVPGSYVDVPNSYYKLFKWLFSIVLASDRRGPSLIPGRDMSVSGLLVYFRIEMTLVKSLHTILYSMKISYFLS